MMDKQIIIDGVDVSGCTRYCADNGKCTAFKSQYLCSERNNCYTKRILKKNKTINILKEKLLCKEQECEELKFKVHDLRQLRELDREARERFVQQLDQLKAENNLFRTCHDNEQAKRRKYEQALTEIEEIAENREIFCENCTGGVKDFTCNDCGYVKILQKISEVENDNK